MTRNYTRTRQFTSSLAHRLGRLVLIALLACGLLYPASAQNTNRAQKAPPQQKQKQQVEVEKKTGVENNAIKALAPGSLKGKIDFFYMGLVSIWSPNIFLSNDSCSQKDIVIALNLVDSKGKTVASDHLKPMTPNGSSPYCTFDIKNVPPGDYKMRFTYAPQEWRGNKYSGLAFANYFSPPKNSGYACHPGSSRNPKSGQDPCAWSQAKTVTIQPGKVSMLDLTGIWSY